MRRRDHKPANDTPEVLAEVWAMEIADSPRSYRILLGEPDLWDRGPVHTCPVITAETDLITLGDEHTCLRCCAIHLAYEIAEHEL